MTAEVTAEPVVTEEVVEEVTAPTFVVDIEPAANTEE